MSDLTTLEASKACYGIALLFNDKPA
jgi:hypothetical protein